MLVKRPSAILSCGALEDSMKKFAIQNGLNVYDSDLSQVVNALKSGGYLKGTQAGLVQSFVKLSNKAFHAQFDKMENARNYEPYCFRSTILITKF